MTHVKVFYKCKIEKPLIEFDFINNKPVSACIECKKLHRTEQQKCELQQKRSKRFKK